MNTCFRLISVVSLVSLGACTDAPGSTSLSTTDEELSAYDQPDVFVTDNVAAGNSILAFHRTGSGRLVGTDRFPTGGRGTGAGLGSQGAIVRSGRRLFAVNAGSDEISSFEIHGRYLVLRDIVGAGGANPVSLTVHGDLLYVVNAGRDTTAGNIAGFTIDGGRLQPIADASQPLAAGAGPAEIAFDPSGATLVVTEKALNQLLSFPVDAEGRAGAPVVTPSHGQTPFGFAFTEDGALIVSEAFGGAPGASAVSSYVLSSTGVPTLVSGSVPTGQTAACWVALSERGHFAYASNTGSNTVSGYHLGDAGALARFADGGATATTGAGPADAAFGDDNRWLYVLDTHAGDIDVLEMRHDGRLVARDRLTGLPLSAAGLATR